MIGRGSAWTRTGALLVAFAAACGGPGGDRTTSSPGADLPRRPDGPTLVPSPGVSSPAPRVTVRPPQELPSSVRPAQPTPAPAPSGPPLGLEVLVRPTSLDLGWADEPTATIGPWPLPAGARGPLPDLVTAAASYADRERAAAARSSAQTFDGHARLRSEGGAVETAGQLGRLLSSLQRAGYGDVTVRADREPQELRVPLPPRAPDRAAGGTAVLGYLRLRWAPGPDGVWMDGEAVYSEPHLGPDAAPGARPDLPVGLRSAWTCALVDPEPTFTDAVRRATSALKTFRLPHALPIYLEVSPETPFPELWQLARELRAAGHEDISLVTLRSPGLPPADCPHEASNAARLAEHGAAFLAQTRQEGARIGDRLTFLGFVGGSR